MGDEKKDLTQEGRKPDDQPEPQDPMDQGTGGQGPDADTGTGGDEATGTGPSGGGDAPVPEH